MWRINEIFARYSIAGCIKAALQLQGFDVGDPLPPQPSLDEQARQEIAEVLASVDAL
ncbi:4-hydroxy-tetrahydrodipicolinate synthase [Brenneria goodwinii]|uniref:4-hydroxy-tetrahydrodipicolinate synthase n=1 Tax=Brenneria goodwinii TaxID=1109412 RepID=A0A0G4JTH8_9GAMM|nr:4-hydroxy-tetrahydrodipicolinate synthase [Brenneria goodwinii]